MKTRREFMGGSLLGGAALAASGGLSFSSGSAAEPAHTAIANMGSKFDGQLIMPGDPDYESARAVVYHHPRTDKLPSLIARCTGPADVVRCLEVAESKELPIALHSGGHSMVGWGTLNDGVVIDVSRMRKIEIDPVARTATVGAGVLCAELAAAAGHYGLAPVVAQCPTVGVTGLTLGGGLSYLSGLYGASCDTLLAAEMVTADGRTLVCDKSENPDLFWALRGGGGNFGVVTGLTFQLFAVAEVITGSLGYRLEDATEVVRVFRDTMASAPDGLQGWTCVKHDQGESILLVGLCWSGDPRQTDALIEPLRKVAKTTQDTLHQAPFVETFNTYPIIGHGPANSLAGCYMSTLSDEAIDVFVERVSGLDGSFSCTVGLDHYMHGEICRVAPESTAFDLRAPGSLHVWMTANWTDPAAANAALAWGDSSWRALKGFSGGRTYANYPAFEDWSLAGTAYDQNRQRLLSIKNTYDPNNIFNRNYNLVG